MFYTTDVKKILLVAVLLFFVAVPCLYAQELVVDTQETEKAQVVEVLKQETRTILGTDTKSEVQTLRVKIISGSESGKEITVENDYLHLTKGQKFYLIHAENSLDGRDIYSVSEPYRLPALGTFAGLFVLLVVVFGGKQGVRGLISLVGSFLFIFYILLPGVLHGYSPVLVSIAVSSVIIVLGSYVTHGFNKTTSSAVLGMIVTIVFTGVLAYIAVRVTHLSGFSSEEAVYLNFDTRGSIDFSGLLLGGILIGLLGVLYDAAIGQAISVEELYRIGKHLPRRFIFTRALRIGREHIGALVNTIAIAYVGATLPLLLLFYSPSAPILLTLNPLLSH